ncbi:transposase [Rhodococcus erythropolis]|uniref:transposase n=1 Tax=Rhodococcus erythropolis TaxID=1833 RepID=UPI00374F63AB
MNAECVNAENLNESAAQAFRNHPDYAVITSFPGLGEATGARVLAEIGNDGGRFAGARGLKSFAGAAPVTRASGRTISISHRHMKNNRLATGNSLGLRRDPEAGPDQGPLWSVQNAR